MKKKIITTIIAIFTLLVNPILAQESVVDIVTLKNNKGIIKGLISEQVPGETVKIIPSNALIKIDFEAIAGIPSTKSVKKDTTTIQLDVVTLKNGSTIEGDITEQSPGKWLVIKTENLTTQTYRYDEIERFGKETVKADADIFKAYGVLDVLNIKGGVIVKGIIIDQLLGELVKVKTASGILVYNLSDVEKTGKEAFDSKRDIFKQSAYVDVIVLKNGSSIRGIITDQTPGQSLKVETIGNSSFVQPLSDVVKLCKEKNPQREEQKIEIIIKKIEEPEYIGDCFWIKSIDSVKTVEKEGFVNGTKNHNLLLINGKDKSTTRFVSSKEIAFRIKVINNNLDPKSQIYIIKTATDKGTNKRFIDANEHLFLSSQAERMKIPVYPQFTATKVGNSSFDLVLKIIEPGEYAIFVAGCEKSFSLFAVDTVKKNAK